MRKSRNKLITSVILCLMIFSGCAGVAKGDPAVTTGPQMTNVTCMKSETIFKTGDTFSFGFSLLNTTSQPSLIRLRGSSIEFSETGNLSLNDYGIYLIENSAGYADAYGYSADCFEKDAFSVVRSGDHYTVSAKVKAGKIFRIENAYVYVEVDGAELRENVGTFYFDDGCYKGNHTYFANTPTQVKPATCEKAGSESVQCIKCHSTVTLEVFPAEGHSWSEWYTDAEPSCTQEGKRSRFCNSCWITEEEPIRKTDHSWGEWQVVKKASVSDTGTKERVCALCNGKQSKTIAKLVPTLKLGKTSVKLAKTKSVTLKAAFARGDAISAKSSNKKIAKVQVSSGKIRITAGKTAGTANITVKTTTGIKAVVKVTVPKVKTTKITCKEVSVKKGGKAALKPAVKPAYSDDEITFKSADRKIATVSSKGVVKGIGKGKTTITVKSGKKSVKVKVTVR